MSVHDLCCIGYITQDKIVTTKNTIYMPGGTSFYFAHAIKHLDPNGFLLVTSLAHTEMNVVEDIRKEGIEVKALPSARSVCFENIYGENQNERTQRVTAKADPFTMEGLQDVNARIIHLGSLLADDFSLDVIKYLSGKGLLSVDVQGFLRKVDNEKAVSYTHLSGASSFNKSTFPPYSFEIKKRKYTVPHHENTQLSEHFYLGCNAAVSGIDVYKRQGRIYILNIIRLFNLL